VISLRDQAALIRGCFPSFRTNRPGGELVANGEVQPTPRSSKYRLRITCRATDNIPQVHVVSPLLGPREPGGSLPHIYLGDRLCLYLPFSGEWSKHRSIAQTIIPWAIDWLFHYEVWHATGEWLGGGVEPNGVKSTAE